MIYIVKNHKAHATVDCSKEAGGIFLNSGRALWDRHRRTWVVELNQLPSLIQWLREHSHTVITDDDLDKSAPQPPPYTRGDIDWEHQAAINARGAAAARAALRQEQP